MKVVDVKEQVRLSLGKCMELVLSGLRFRLFRAAITVTIIALAGAFLTAMLTESLVSRRVAAAIDERTLPRDQFDLLKQRISLQMTEQDLATDLANDPSNAHRSADRPARLKELQAWGGISDEELKQVADLATRQLGYQRFFDQMDEGPRRALLGSARTGQVFHTLQDEAAFQHFCKLLPELGIRGRFPDADLDSFKSFLRQWQEAEPIRRKILDGHEKVVQDLKDHVLKSRDSKVVLATVDESLLKELHARGFQVTQAALDSARQQAALNVDLDKLMRAFAEARIKRGLENRLNTKIADLSETMFLDEVAGGSGSKWFAGIAKEAAAAKIVASSKVSPVITRILPEEPAPKGKAKPASKPVKVLTAAERDELTRAAGLLGQALALSPQDREANALVERIKRNAPDVAVPTVTLTAAQTAQISEDTRLPVDLSPERIRDVASWRLSQQSLSRVEAAVEDKTNSAAGWMGFSSRTMWLLIVSFLVCIVGIANAMLMSVTERFREIATMKCLGATDGFIMVNFILESCMQGVSGGLVGALLGLLLGATMGIAKVGWMAMANFPLAETLTGAGVAVAVGVVVSAVAAVYPAWVAARLAPMEAMRIE